MGDGQILEQGTHQELLTNADGPYSRLVQAQHLKEGQPITSDVEDIVSLNPPMAPVEIEGAAKAEVPLGRTDTFKSIATEDPTKGLLEPTYKRPTELSLFYLFRRMGLINSSQWPFYLVAFTCAGSTCHIHCHVMFLTSGLLIEQSREWCSPFSLSSTARPFKVSLFSILSRSVVLAIAMHYGQSSASVPVTEFSLPLTLGSS